MFASLTDAQWAGFSFVLLGMALICGMLVRRAVPLLAAGPVAGKRRDRVHPRREGRPGTHHGRRRGYGYKQLFYEPFLGGGVLTARSVPIIVGCGAAPQAATVPFTLRNLKADLEDVGSRFDGAPDLEFRLATGALELEQSGLGYQSVPPGYRFPYGHTHRTQEEVYVVVRGSGRMKLDDEIVELEQWDAVRVPPGTWRGYEAGADGLEILVIGAPNLGDAPREDVEGRRDWWAD